MCVRARAALNRFKKHNFVAWFGKRNHESQNDLLYQKFTPKNIQLPRYDNYYNKYCINCHEILNSDLIIFELIGMQWIPAGTLQDRLQALYNPHYSGVY